MGGVGYYRAVGDPLHRGSDDRLAHLGQRALGGAVDVGVLVGEVVHHLGDEVHGAQLAEGLQRDDLGKERALGLEHAQAPFLRLARASLVVPADRGDGHRQLGEQMRCLELGQLQQRVQVAPGTPQRRIGIESAGHRERRGELEADQPLLELLAQALDVVERGLGRERADRGADAPGQVALLVSRNLGRGGAGPPGDGPYDVGQAARADALCDLPDRGLAQNGADVAVVAGFDGLDRLAQLDVSGRTGAEAPAGVVDAQGVHQRAEGLARAVRAPPVQRAQEARDELG